jgi:hypothetical protein
VSKKFGEWLQKKKEDTNKLTLLAFKILVILHDTLLATFIKLLETVSKGLFRNRSQNRCLRRRQIRGIRWVDFFLFPRLKSIMKGTRFADVAAIQ